MRGGGHGMEVVGCGGGRWRAEATAAVTKSWIWSNLPIVLPRLPLIRRGPRIPATADEARARCAFGGHGMEVDGW